MGSLAGELERDTLATRVRLVLVALRLAVVTNWVRVYVIILAGYLTDMQHYLVRVDHYRFGWVLFAVAMALFFVWMRRLPPGAGPVRAWGGGRNAHAWFPLDTRAAAEGK